MRLFVSVDLDGMKEPLSTAQIPFEDVDGVRLVEPSQVHVTLKFLGTVDSERLDVVTTVLEDSVGDAGISPFDAEVGGYGAFPSYDYISVIWVGIRNGGEELRRLHEAIEARMVELDFDPADHEFTPHATIARMDHAGGKAHVQEILRKRDPAVGSVRVTEIRLTESTLTPDGPEYETVTAVEL